jgi:methanogenic corrinoid protein MtbC1
MSDDLSTKITGSIVEGEPDETPELTRQALDSGLEPLTIINGSVAGEIRENGTIFFSLHLERLRC